MNDYFTQISNNIAASISKQKDNLIYQVLRENNIDYTDLTNLSRNGRFIKQEGKNYQIFNYSGRDLLEIYEPEIKCNDDQISCEVKYKKLY